MLSKLTVLFLLPVGVDADTASQFVGRWQSEPLKAESGKTMTVEFRVRKENSTKDDARLQLLSVGTVAWVDQVDVAKGYMVASVIRSENDIGPGTGNRTLVEFSQQKGGQFPLTLKIGAETATRFVRRPAEGPEPPEGNGAHRAVEYLRVTSREMNAGTVAGLHHTTSGRTQNERIQGVLNYLGGHGWDVVFVGETLVCKRPLGGRTRWEFMVWEVNPSKLDLFDAAVKDAGREGWELNAIHDGWRTVILKRPLPQVRQEAPEPGPKKPEEAPSRPVIK